jgi:hypothetical protein
MSAKYFDLGMALYHRHKDSPNLPAIMVSYTDKFDQTKSGKPMTAGSRASSLSKLKKQILTMHYPGGEDVPENLQEVKYNRKFYETINKQATKNLDARSTQIPIVPDGRKLLRKVLPGLMSNDFGALFSALALASGRRTGELLYSGTLTPIAKTRGKGLKLYYALFSGQLKKGGEEGDPYPIPLLAPAPLVIDALERLQTMAMELKHDPFATQLTRAVQKAVGNTVPFPVSPHTLRKFYTLIAFKLFNRDRDTITRFASRALGHDGTGSVPNYIVYDVQKVGVTPWKPSPPKTPEAPLAAPEAPGV